MNGRKLLLMGLLMVFGGIALMAASLEDGGSSAGVFLVIPFFVTTSPLGAIGSLLLFLGVFVTFLGWAAGDSEIVLAGPEELHGNGPRPVRGREGAQGRPPGDRKAARRYGSATKGKDPGGKVRGGAVVFIGPVPVVAGSDPAMTRTLMIIGGVIMALMMVFYLALWLA